MLYSSKIWTKWVDKYNYDPLNHMNGLFVFRKRYMRKIVKRYKQAQNKKKVICMNKEGIWLKKYN